MRVSGNLAAGQHHRFRAGILAHHIAAAAAVSLADRTAASQIGHGKGVHPISTVRGSKQDEQDFKLSYREERAITKHPTLWSKVEAHNSNFANVWFTHLYPPVAFSL